MFSFLMELVMGGPFKAPFPGSQVTRANNLEQYSVVLVKTRDLSCKNSFVESITSRHTEQCNAVMGPFLYLSYYFCFGCNTVILADPYSWGTAMCRNILSVGAFVRDIFSSTRVQHGLVLTSEMQKRPNTNAIPTFYRDVIWHHVVHALSSCALHESIVVLSIVVFPCSLLHLLESELLPNPTWLLSF